MFNKILGRTKNDDSGNKEHSELMQKISKMDLTEMKSYVNNRISSMPVSREGLVVVLEHLLKVDKKTNTRYLKIDDNDAKIKKGFDLAIAISTHSLITFPVIKLLQDFIEAHKDIIEKFDRNNKQTYRSKLKKAVENAIITIGMIADINNASDVLKAK
ncbi:MAG: hypothetical protein ABGW74_03125 [Campylobacterales bacterium]